MTATTTQIQDPSVIKQLLLINSLDRHELDGYIKNLRTVYEEDNTQPSSLEKFYNHQFLSNILYPYTRYLLCVMLISYVRGKNTDPCPLWVSVYNSGGNLTKR